MNWPEAFVYGVSSLSAALLIVGLAWSGRSR